MATNSSMGEREGLKQAAVPSAEDLYWPAAMREVQTGLLRWAHMAAAAVLVWSLVGWTVVVVALVSGIVGRSQPVGIGLVIWLLPICWWSLSAIWGLRVLSVRRYRYFANSPDSTHKAIERIGRKKNEHLVWSIGLWIAGVLSLICALAYEVTRGV